MISVAQQTLVHNMTQMIHKGSNFEPWDWGWLVLSQQFTSDICISFINDCQMVGIGNILETNVTAVALT